MLVGQAPNGTARRTRGRLAHRGQRVLVGHDEGAPGSGRAQLAQEVPADNLRAGLGDAQVAAGARGVRVRVHDVADGPIPGNVPDGRQQRRRVLVAHRVNDQHALRSHLHHRVAFRVRDEMHLSLAPAASPGRRPARCCAEDSAPRHTAAETAAKTRILMWGLMIHCRPRWRL